MERLVKWVSHQGGLARRKADEAVFGGRVMVNGVVEQNPARRIDPEHDQVCLDGQQLMASSHEKIIIKLHKPSGYVCTNQDEKGRKTIFDLLDTSLQQERLYCIGRLDKESEGILLITNDGDVHLHLSHPRFEKEKVYVVYMKGCVADEEINHLRTGIDIILEDGIYHTAPCDITVIKRDQKKTQLQMILREGKKRQIRRMAEAIGTTVMYLRRVQFGPISLGDLPLGKAEPLTMKERNALYTLLSI